MSTTDMPHHVGSHEGDWQKRLDLIVDMMRMLARQDDPDDMIRKSQQAFARLLPSDRMVSISRRGLEAPYCRVTRASHWQDQPNPWKQPTKLPLIERALFSELLYAGETRLLNDITVPEDDPAAPFIGEHRSIMAIPVIEDGPALNMLLPMRKGPDAFLEANLPLWALVTNLFGRATLTMLLKQQVAEAYDRIDHELRIVSDIQCSLLPADLPRIPGVELATYYKTSQHAGGDYYDFFPYPDGRWGVLIADVTGHGTPAAVLMAITHAIAHSHPSPAARPSELLTYLNRRLCELYTVDNGRFVTAFYGVYDPEKRQLRYACAGHNPPRLTNECCTHVTHLDAAQSLPLGVDAEEDYADASLQLNVGDRVVFYTDGISEARNPDGRMFGEDRIDRAILGNDGTAHEMLAAIVKAVDQFCRTAPVNDDRTMVVAKVV